MNEPHAPFSDELISAYLDGELTDDERQQVEQTLRVDPRAQQLLEDLRTLRDSVRSLPSAELKPGFHDRVLRRIAEQTPPHGQAIAPSTSSTLPDSGSTFSRRGWFWGAAAVAASILALLSWSALPLNRSLQVAERDEAMTTSSAPLASEPAPSDPSERPERRMLGRDARQTEIESTESLAGDAPERSLAESMAVEPLERADDSPHEVGLRPGKSGPDNRAYWMNETTSAAVSSPAEVVVNVSYSDNPGAAQAFDRWIDERLAGYQKQAASDNVETYSWQYTGGGLGGVESVAAQATQSPRPDRLAIAADDAPADDAAEGAEDAAASSLAMQAQPAPTGQRTLLIEAPAEEVSTLLVSLRQQTGIVLTYATPNDEASARQLAGSFGADLAERGNLSSQGIVADDSVNGDGLDGQRDGVSGRGAAVMSKSANADVELAAEAAPAVQSPATEAPAGQSQTGDEPPPPLQRFEIVDDANSDPAPSEQPTADIAPTENQAVENFTQRAELSDQAQQLTPQTTRPNTVRLLIILPARPLVNDR